jgi:hypothetical protein
MPRFLGVPQWYRCVPGTARGSLRTAAVLVSGRNHALTKVITPMSMMYTATGIVLPVFAMSAVMRKGVPPLTMIAESW